MRRGWLVAALLVGVAAIAIAVVAARLAGDDEPSAAAWADSVCASLNEWRASVVALTDVSGGLDKESLEQRLAEAEEATSELVSDLRALGPPNLEGGEELEQELEAVASSLEGQVEMLARDAGEALEEATTPADLFQSLATLAPQFQALLTSAADAVDALASADVAAQAKAGLEQAFASAESCQELRGAS